MEAKSKGLARLVAVVKARVSRRFGARARGETILVDVTRFTTFGNDGAFLNLSRDEAMELARELRRRARQAVPE